MQIVDAYWEKRNLGVSTQECIIEADDSVETVILNINELSADYQVIKAPVGRIELYSELQKQGFTFAETSFEISHSLKEMPVSMMMKRLKDAISYSVVNEKDMIEVRSQIRKGMFISDRVYLDPMFSPEQAANRYVGWMEDEEKRGSLFFNFEYKKEKIGFMCCRMTEKRILNSMLGGVYASNSAMPFGSALMTKQLDIAKDLGAVKFVTHISSNNLQVVRVYSSFGYVVERINYVFIKHKKIGQE